MKKFIVAGVAAIGLVCGMGGSASATEVCYVVKKITVYEKEVCFETKSVPYEVCVTKYDHCGNPYTDHVVKFKTIEVKVVKEVPVVKYVKVPVASY